MDIANIALFIIALLHLWFAILEMFLWTKPLGIKTFKLSQEFANQSAPLAANQGLYNAFLSAGLFWGAFTTEMSIKLFFVCCVIIAGIYAGVTVNRRIFYVQALPAIVALALLYV